MAVEIGPTYHAALGRDGKVYEWIGDTPPEGYEPAEPQGHYEITGVTEGVSVTVER